MIRINLKLFMILFSFLEVKIVFSQEIKKDITIVKSYQPVIRDFNKINLMPVFSDTTTIIPQFNYSIQSEKAIVSFQPRPVPIAKMAPEAVPVLTNNFVTMSFGNPWSPLIDAGFSTGRSKQYNVGLFLHHHSARGKVFLENSTNKIDAPFSENNIDLYARSMFKKAVISGNINYQSKNFNYYGITNNSINLYRNDSMQQILQKVSLELCYNSLNSDSNNLISSVNTKFLYFTDKNNHIITSINASFDVGKMFNEFFVGSSIKYTNYVSSGTNDSSYNSIITFRPYLQKSKNEWQLKGGIHISSFKNDTSNTLYVFPFASFNFIILPRVLRAIISYEGYVESNNYYSLTLKNPYIQMGYFGKNTSCNTSIRVMLSGSMSNEITYSLSGNYQQVKNYIFFVNSVDSPFYNKFVGVYDDVELFQFSLVLNYSINPRLNFMLQSKLQNFTLLHQKKPWGIPLYEFEGILNYSLHNKIFTKTTFNFIGTRYGIEPFSTITKSLKPIFTINQKIEYRYTPKFYIFIEGKNLTAHKYQYWNQYLHYRFQLIGGFSYRF